MEYRQVVAVTGLSGLYLLMSTKNDGAIVRSLVDNSTKFISARVHHITPLESIEIYTTGENNVRLHEVLETIKGDDTKVLALNKQKDDKAARALFAEILPTFDESRVYTSDIKKIYKWYEILKGANLLDFESMKRAMANEVIQADVVLEKDAETDTEEKPKAKKVKKADETTEDGEEKPKKVAAKKVTKKKEAE